MSVTNVSSFLPVAGDDVRVLILGSMPGVASLQAQRYYAHPRNAFWPIMAALCGFDPELPYEQRLLRLQRKGIALWDVLANCVRPGSLDSAIDPDSMRTNDFVTFLAVHPGVRAVFCNGGTAFRLFRQRVRPSLPEAWSNVSVHQLPSTSPAHASLRLAAKQQVWLRAVQTLLR